MRGVDAEHGQQTEAQQAQQHAVPVHAAGETGADTWQQARQWAVTGEGGQGCAAPRPLYLPSHEALSEVVADQALGHVDRTPQLHGHQRRHAQVVLPAIRAAAPVTREGTATAPPPATRPEKHNEGRTWSAAKESAALSYRPRSRDQAQYGLDFAYPRTWSTHIIQHCLLRQLPIYHSALAHPLTMMPTAPPAAAPMLLTSIT